MPNLLVLDHDQVRALLPMTRAIEVMAEALETLARGGWYQPLRVAHRPPGAAGILGLMPCWRRESGDYRLAVAEGAIPPDHPCAELGEVLIGAHPGRRHEAEITIFESLGLAAEDLAAAVELRRRALATGAGTWLAF